MLVATPGQTATYTLHPAAAASSGGASKKTCHTNNSASANSNTTNATPKTTTNNNNNNNGRSDDTPSSTVDALVKSLSVRLNRSTEFLMGTVQKAFVTTNNNNSKNNNTTAGQSNNQSKSSNNHHHPNHHHNINASKPATTTTTNNNNSNATAATTTTAAAAKAKHSVTFRTNVPTSAAGGKSISSKPATGGKAASSSHTTSSSKAAHKLHTVPPTVLHRYPEERKHAGSTDSLHMEMCHFKPIRVAPVTPWKCGSKSRGASLKQPKATRPTKVRFQCDATNSQEAASGTPKQFKPKPSSTLLTTIVSTPSHQSAFACLVAQMQKLSNTKTPKGSHMKLVSSLDLHRTRSMRERPKLITHPRKAGQPSPMNLPLTRLIRRTCTQPYASLRKLQISNELVLEGKNSAKERKSGDMGPMIKISARRTKRKTARKSKMIDIVAFAQERKKRNQKKAGESGNDNSNGAATLGDLSVVNTTAKRKTRKRQHKQIEKTQSIDKIADETNANADTGPPLRKSARLSKDQSNESLRLAGGDRAKPLPLTKAQQREADRQRLNCFSPPMTRLRLRRLMQRTQNTTTQTTGAGGSIRARAAND